MKKPVYHIADALHELRPGSGFIVHDTEDANSIEWTQLPDGVEPPTVDEINTLVVQRRAETENIMYQYDRSKAYPSIAEQLDTLYHGGYDAWKASITEIKERFPKP